MYTIFNTCIWNFIFIASNFCNEIFYKKAFVFIILSKLFKAKFSKHKTTSFLFFSFNKNNRFNSFKVIECINNKEQKKKLAVIDDFG